MTSPFPALVLSFILLSFITFYFTTTNVFAQNWTNYNLDGKFSFKYPSDWFVSGTQNRFESFALVAPPNGTAGVWFTLRDNNPGYIDDDEILLGMESGLSKSWDNFKIFEKGTDKYIINNQTAPYIIATYDEARTFPSKNLAALIVFVKFGDSWIDAVYSSDKDEFDKNLGTVEKIMKSIRPV